MDDLAYRPIPEGRRDEYGRLMTYAFTPSDGPQRGDTEESDDEDGVDPDVDDRYGLFDSDTIVSTVNHLELRARLRGGWHSLGGVSEVSTPPEYRHQGYVRRLLVESLADYRTRDWHFSALWPFSTPFYRKMGWATCNRVPRADLPPGELTGVEKRRDGEAAFVRLEPDDWECLHAVRLADADDAPLAVDRTGEWWRTRVFEHWGQANHVYGAQRDGDLAGYLVYTIDDHDDGEGKRLDVRDHAARDHAAWLDLLGFCYRHGSQVERVRFAGPRADSLLDLADDPAAVDYEVEAGPMFRLVDLSAGLEAIDYPADGSLDLSVSDPIADWNEGTFELTVADGEATVERTDVARGGADVETDIGTLSQLVAGYRPAATTERYGDLTCAGDRERERLAALFPERNPFLAERF